MSEKGLSLGAITGAGLGDILVLTSICKQVPNCTVNLPKSAKKFGCLFDNLATVTYDPKKINTPGKGPGIWHKRKLRHFGLDTDDYLPTLKFTDEELQSAKQELSQYNNPVIFVSNCSKQWKHLREFNNNKWQQIIDIISENHTVLQFGLSSNHTKFNNCTPILDLPIRKLATYYKVIGKYVGVNTGDMHLAVSCQCKIWVLQPSRGFEKGRWQYDESVGHFADYEKFDKFKQIIIQDFC